MISLEEYKKLRELLHGSNEDYEVGCENIKNMKETTSVTKMMFAKSLMFGRRQGFCEKFKIDYYAIKEWNEMFKSLGYKAPNMKKHNTSKHTKKRTHYSHYYNDEAYEFVTKLFKKDLPNLAIVVLGITCLYPGSSSEISNFDPVINAAPCAISSICFLIYTT